MMNGVVIAADFVVSSLLTPLGRVILLVTFLMQLRWLLLAATNFVNDVNEDMSTK